MKRFVTMAAVALAAAMLAPGCGDDGATGGASVDGPGVDVFGIDGLGGGSDDATSPGGGEPGSKPGGGGGDDQDVEAGDVGTGEGASCDEHPVGFRCPCENNTDCESGWCIEDVVGRVCTVTCLETCPGGWQCRSVQNVGEDVVYLCVPELVGLCAPCESDDDCGGEADLCVSVGDGRFCAADCVEDSDCPVGYGCVDQTSVGGVSAKQCVPTTGSCICTPDLVGTTTACSVKNEFGTCFGESSCLGVEGWSACSAEEAVEETCDGLDNDCDGQFDEDSAGCVVYFSDNDGDGYGSDEGAKCLCGPDGPYTVSKPGDCDDDDAERNPSVAETCNGLDDNCNGLIDEGCDVDQDGFCASSEEGVTDACPNGGGDCDDLNAKVNPASTEVCNGFDDDCDGLVDEEGGAPCGGCSKVCQLEAGPDGEPFQPNGTSGTGIAGDGTVRIDATSLKLHMLWVANSGENTVSKIDTDTGKEVARYTVCGDPSRTAVDLDGDCWVACRADGKIAQIALEQTECIDTNGNGIIDTSWDDNGDGTIQASEMLAEGQDECVVLVVQPEPNEKARAVAIDAENHPWVGYYATRRLHRLHPLTGEILTTVDFSSVTSGKIYGMAIDQKGRLWVSLRDGNPNALGMVDLTKFPIEPKAFPTPDNHATYGVAVDSLGYVWIAGGESRKVSRFDPKNLSWKTVEAESYPHMRGIAASMDGLVYVAHHDFTTDCAGGKDHYVSVLDAATGTWISAIDISTGNDKLGPVGLAIDFDDHLWAINQCSSSATKIDRKTKKVLGHYKTGQNPYTYSDMTGFALKTVVAPEGAYTHVFEGWSGKQTQWLNLSVAALTPDGTNILVRYRTADDASDFVSAAWSETMGPFPPETMPLNLTKNGVVVAGRYLQVEVTLLSGGQGISPVLTSIDAVATALE